MSVHIVADSASDISQEEAARLGITVMPLKIMFGDEEYLDGVTLSPDEFFEKLVEGDIFPKTSQVSVFDYTEAYRRAIDEGDEVLCVTISSGVSGTYQSACIAADDIGEKVTVVDSRSFSLGERVMVLRAVELRDKGLSVSEIAEQLKKDALELKVIAVFDTLEYLKKGGRLSAAVAFAGTLMNIKPIIAIIDGVVAVPGKVRGFRNGNAKLKEMVEKDGGVDFTKPFSIAYSGDNENNLDMYLEDSKDVFKAFDGELPITKIGATIGTYAGPGAVGLAYFPNSTQNS